VTGLRILGGISRIIPLFGGKHQIDLRASDVGVGGSGGSSGAVRTVVGVTGSVVVITILRTSDVGRG
jgi:hypothetical protein